MSSVITDGAISIAQAVEIEKLWAAIDRAKTVGYWECTCRTRKFIRFEQPHLDSRHSTIGRHDSGCSRRPRLVIAQPFKDRIKLDKAVIREALANIDGIGKSKELVLATIALAEHIVEFGDAIVVLEVERPRLDDDEAQRNCPSAWGHE